MTTRPHKAPEGTRWCPSCKRFVAHADYSRSRAGPDGFGGACRVCRALSRQDRARRLKGKPDLTIEKRFWEKVRKTPTCWEWTGTKCVGYGHISYQGEMRCAHRVSLILAGHDLPDDMDVDHMCRNPGCVRPSHLRIVTPVVNAMENNLSPHATNAKLTKCLRGHPFTPENMVIVHVKRRRNRQGKLRPGGPTRVCLICYKLRRPEAKMYQGRQL